MAEEKANTTEVARFITVQTAMLGKRIERHADRYLRRVMQIGLNEWRLMAHVYGFSHYSIAEIARIMNLPLVDVGIMVEKLSARYFMHYTPGDDGGRAEPTGIGEGIYQTIVPHMRRREQEIVVALTEQEMQSYYETLGKLIARMDHLLKEGEAAARENERRSTDYPDRI